MALKDNWKDTGKGLGSAFSNLGKSIVRSAVTGVEKASDWAEDDGSGTTPPKTPESNVFNDGTWRQTGKDLGKALTGVGRSIVDSAGAGLGKLDDALDGSDKPQQ